MKMKLMIAIGLLGLSGCATAGSPEVRDIGRYLSLQKGESTKHDIYGTFGQPYDVRSADQGTAWFYYRISIRMNAATLIPFLGVVFGGSDIDSTRAKFSFNSDERLTGVETEEKSNYVNQWAGIAMAVASSTGNAEQRVKAEMVRLGLPYDPNLSRKRQVDVPND